jgi:hypothetical protein
VLSAWIPATKPRGVVPQASRADELEQCPVGLFGNDKVPGEPGVPKRRFRPELVATHDWVEHHIIVADRDMNKHRTPPPYYPLNQAVEQRSAAEMGGEVNACLIRFGGYPLVEGIGTIK